MRRFLIIFALALIPIQVILYLVWQYYSIPLTFSAAAMRMLGGAIAAGYIARRIDRQMGGRKQAGAEEATPAIYQRPTADQLAGLGGKTEEGAQPPAVDVSPATDAPLTLAERLRQKTRKD
jgi:hypothetical protein